MRHNTSETEMETVRTPSLSLLSCCLPSRQQSDSQTSPISTSSSSSSEGTRKPASSLQAHSDPTADAKKSQVPDTKRSFSFPSFECQLPSMKITKKTAKDCNLVDTHTVTPRAYSPKPSTSTAEDLENPAEPRAEVKQFPNDTSGEMKEKTIEHLERCMEHKVDRQRALLNLKRAEDEYMHVMKTVGMHERAKKVLHMEWVTGINATTQTTMPQDAKKYKKMKNHLSIKIKELKVKEKQLKKKYDKAEKCLKKITEKEVRTIRMGWRPQSFGDKYMSFMSTFKSRQRTPRYNPTLTDDEEIEVCEEVDKNLGVLYSDAKRNVQIYEEVKRRLQQHSKDLMGVEIPTQFVTSKQKNSYLDFKIEKFREQKRRLKKEIAIHQEFMNWMKSSKENKKGWKVRRRILQPLGFEEMCVESEQTEIPGERSQDLGLKKTGKWTNGDSMRMTAWSGLWWKLSRNSKRETAGSEVQRNCLESEHAQIPREWLHDLGFVENCLESDQTKISGDSRKLQGLK